MVVDSYDYDPLWKVAIQPLVGAAFQLTKKGRFHCFAFPSLQKRCPNPSYTGRGA